MLLSALDTDKPTKKAIVNVIRAVARWKNVVEVLGTTANLDKIDSMEEELKVLMLGLGGEAPKKSLSQSKSLILLTTMYLIRVVTYQKSRKSASSL